MCSNISSKSYPQSTHILTVMSYVFFVTSLIRFTHIASQVHSNQYSVTDNERDLSRIPEGDERNAQGTHITHGIQGLPGAFFHFEISPMLVTHRETRPSFAHFMTSYVSLTCKVPRLLTLI